MPTREVLRDSIAIVGGSIIKVDHFDKRGERGDKKIDKKENNDKKSDSSERRTNQPTHSRYQSDLPVCPTCGCNQPIHQATNTNESSRQGRVTEAMLEFEESDLRSTPRRTQRRTARYKGGEEEFFNMTYLSNLLPHPQHKKLIEI